MVERGWSTGPAIPGNVGTPATVRPPGSRVTPFLSARHPGELRVRRGARSSRSGFALPVRVPGGDREVVSLIRSYCVSLGSPALALRSRVNGQG